MQLWAFFKNFHVGHPVTPDQCLMVLLLNYQLFYWFYWCLLDHWVSLDQDGFPVRSSLDLEEEQMFGACPLVVFVWRKWRSAGEVLLWKMERQTLSAAPPSFSFSASVGLVFAFVGSYFYFTQTFLQKPFLSAGLQEPEWSCLYFISCPHLSASGPLSFHYSVVFQT